MNFTCPSCGAEASLDVVITHQETRQLMVAILELSLPLGALVTRYLRLFKPAKQQLRPERVRKLLEALVPDITRQHITRKGREWHVTPETWKLGLEAVLDNHAAGKLDLPLQDHGYLHAVLMHMADKHEAREEAASEAASEAARRGERSFTNSASSVSQVISDMDGALQRAQTAVDRLVPPPTGPSAYARRIHAQNEARRQQREGGFSGDSTADGGTE